MIFLITGCMQPNIIWHRKTRVPSSNILANITVSFFSCITATSPLYYSLKRNICGTNRGHLLYFSRS